MNKKIMKSVFVFIFLIAATGVWAQPGGGGGGQGNGGPPPATSGSVDDGILFLVTGVVLYTLFWKKEPNQGTPITK